MLSVSSCRRALVLACAVLVTVAMVSPVAAQSTGMLRGKVVDGADQPIEAAKVTIEYRDGISRTNITKTNKKGEYTMVGLTPGNYRVTAEKEKVGAQAADSRVRLGETTELNFKLAAGGGAPAKEEVAKAAAIRKVFDEGVAASRSGDSDTALAKFAEAITIVPSCYDCYYNMGYAYAQKKDYEKAEEVYKKAIEIKPEDHEVYNGLAQVYNVQKKFDEAQAASQKAVTLSMAGGAGGGAGGADSGTTWASPPGTGERPKKRRRPSRRRSSSTPSTPTRTTSSRCVSSTSASCPRPRPSSNSTCRSRRTGSMPRRSRRCCRS